MKNRNKERRRIFVGERVGVGAVGSTVRLYLV